MMHLRAVLTLGAGALFCIGIAVAGMVGHGRAGEIVPALLMGLAFLAGTVWFARRHGGR
jgi:hypothetical protein